MQERRCETYAVDAPGVDHGIDDATKDAPVTVALVSLPKRGDLPVFPEAATCHEMRCFWTIEGTVAHPA